jgi:ABC-type proline/glycine betaine transport system permease subunit
MMLMNIRGWKARICTVAIVVVLVLVAMLGGIATYIGEANAARVQGVSSPTGDVPTVYGASRDSWSVPDPFYDRE